MVLIVANVLVYDLLRGETPNLANTNRIESR